MWIKCLCLVWIALLSGCSKQPTQAKRILFAAPTEVAKVRVDPKGKVYLNERAVSIEDLKKEFARLREIHGGVWFVDENSSEASREQTKIVKRAIIDAGLPMRLQSG